MTRHRLRFLCAATLFLAGLCGSSALSQEVTRKEFDDLKQELATLKQQVQSLDSTLKSLNGSLPMINQKLSELDALAQNVAILNDKLEAMADGDTGIPSILGNMQKS